MHRYHCSDICCMKQYSRSFRLLGFLSLFCLSAFLPCSLSAQIVTNWTVDMTSDKIPAGVTIADIDTLVGYTFIRFEIELDATTYDNATKATAFNAIGAAVDAAIDSTWVDTWGLDDEDGDGVIIIRNIQRSWDNYDGSSGIAMYGVAEDVYRCTGVFKYILD